MTGVRDEPWWASGTDPADGVGDEDPLAAHREARRGNPGGATEEGAGDDGDGRGRARTTHDTTRDTTHDGGAGDTHRHRAGDTACQACPVCTALRALEESRPELVAHLGEAMRHLSLAAKAFMEAQSARTGGSDGLERIDLDVED